MLKVAGIGVSAWTLKTCIRNLKMWFEIVRYGVVAVILCAAVPMLRIMLYSWMDRLVGFQDILELPTGVYFRVERKIQSEDRYIVERIRKNPFHRRVLLVESKDLGPGLTFDLNLRVGQQFEILQTVKGREVSTIEAQPKTSAKPDPFGVFDDEPAVERDRFGDTINLSQSERW